MAEKLTLGHQSLGKLVLMIVDARVVIERRGKRVFQTLSTSAEAEVHFARIKNLKMKEGYYVLESQKEVDVQIPDADELDIDEFSGEIKCDNKWFFAHLDFEPSRSTLTSRMCAALLHRIKISAPRVVQISSNSVSIEKLERVVPSVLCDTVTSFVFDDPYQSASRQYDSKIGSLASFFEVFPNLRNMFVCGKFRGQNFQHNTLRCIHLMAENVKSLRPIAEATLPCLETLALSFESSSRRTDNQILEIIESVNTKEKLNIYLDGLFDVPNFMNEIFSLKLIRNCDHLYLGGESVEADSVRKILEKRSEIVSQLKSFSLSFEDASDVMDLKKICPKVTEAASWAFDPMVYSKW